MELPPLSAPCLSSSYEDIKGHNCMYASTYWTSLNQFQRSHQFWLGIHTVPLEGAHAVWVPVPQPNLPIVFKEDSIFSGFLS